MSPTRAIDRLRARREADQSGFTLIEVLLVVGITGLLVGPLLAWMMLVMRQQPVEQDGMIRTAQASLLRSYFPQDVANAGGADVYAGDPVDGRWENWRQECIGGGGEDGRKLVVLLTQDAELVKTIYSVAPSQDDEDETALWRDRCDADTGQLRETTQLIERVVDTEPDGTPRTVASCYSADDDDAPCRQVNLSVAIPDAFDLVELSATRRADARSLDRDPATGNILPVALIDILSYERIDEGSLRVRVGLSARSSYDDGSILEYRWELPTAPEPNPAYTAVTGADQEADQVIELNEVGTYTARLTVVDDQGGTDTTYRRIAVVENRRPTADAVVGPNPVISGQQLTLDGTASTDLDGSIVSHRWRLRSALPDVENDDEFVVELQGAKAEWTVPEWAFGPIVVELIVTDDRGKVNSKSTVIEIVDLLPAPGDEDVDPNEPVDPGEPEPEPEPGAPVANFIATVGTGNSVSFDAGGSSGSIVSYTWDFGLLADAGNGGPTIDYSYPAPGTYTARLTVTDDQGRTATRAALVVIPGAPQAPTNVRVQDNLLLWDPRPGARRYLVDLQSDGPGCARTVTDLATAASANPSRALPPNPCTGESTVRARDGTEAVAGGPVAWSGWIDVPTEVVK